MAWTKLLCEVDVTYHSGEPWSVGSDIRCPEVEACFGDDECSHWSCRV